jgi:transcriptional regulator with XRE-family HTH domain
MKTGKAIETLRRALGVPQKAFAEILGTRITTVSRWENGRSEPGQDSLRKLMEHADSAGLQHLGNFFEAKRLASIEARVDRARAIALNAERHVPLEHLKYVSVVAWHVMKQMDELLGGTGIPENVQHAWRFDVRRKLDLLRDENELYIAEEWSSQRQREDEKLLKSRRPRPEMYGLRGQIIDPEKNAKSKGEKH